MQKYMMYDSRYAINIMETKDLSGSLAKYFGNRQEVSDLEVLIDYLEKHRDNC